MEKDSSKKTPSQKGLKDHEQYQQLQKQVDLLIKTTTDPAQQQRLRDLLLT